MIAFADVWRYTKPQPSLRPDVDCTLRTIASWQFLIKSDLMNAFYQIPLSKSSMKYCGVATPFKGTLVYNRSAMGMLGSETALEELMCQILGDFVQEGCAAKIADDMCVGGNSLHELQQNWWRVLSALAKCDIRLSARLLWLWSLLSFLGGSGVRALYRPVPTASPPFLHVILQRQFVHYGLFSVLSRSSVVSFPVAQRPRPH